MDISVVIPIIVAFVMAIPGIYAASAQMKKETASVTKAAQDAALEIINPLREEVKLLRSRVNELECLIEVKNNRIAELEKMVADRDDKIENMEAEIIDLRDRLEVVEKRRKPKAQE